MTVVSTQKLKDQAHTEQEQKTTAVFPNQSVRQPNQNQNTKIKPAFPSFSKIPNILSKTHMYPTSCIVKGIAQAFVLSPTNPSDTSWHSFATLALPKIFITDTSLSTTL